MRPLSYAPPAPQSRASPGSGRVPRPPPCALPFPEALRAAAAAAAVSLSLLTGNAVGAVVAAAAAQPVEVCRDGVAAVVEKVRAEAVTNKQLLEEAWEVVNESFLPNAGSRPWSPEMWMQRKQDVLQGTIKSRARAHDIIRKMLASLGDPYTRFLAPSEGDELLSVNGIDVRAKSAFDASSMLQGPKETFVTIKVKHGDCGPVESIKAQRQVVARTPVFYCLEKRENDDSSVGYIRIKEFNAVAKKDSVSALKRLQNSGASYFVLDLRENLGGLVQAGIETAKLFLNKGDTVIYTAGRDRQVQNTIVAESGPMIATPLMLLVNNRTASSSEIVASALHDNCKAVLVGERTFGKGLIQSVFDFMMVLVLSSQLASMLRQTTRTSMEME